MDLPAQRRERGEVVLPGLGLDPRQAITAANVPGGALAQRAVSIMGLFRTLGEGGSIEWSSPLFWIRLIGPNVAPG